MSWPTNAGCDVQSAVAMPAGGRPLDSLQFTFEQDPRTTAAKAGAASWENGTLQLTLTNRAADPLHVESVQPRVVRTEPRPRLDWVLEKPKGCGGGEAQRSLKYDLDRDRLLIREGEEESPYGSGGDSSLSGLTVTRDKPAYLRFAVRSCRAYYEWVVDITYTIGNERLSHRVDGLRSAGGVAGVPVYTMTANPDGTRKTEPSGRVTSARCASKG
ncbi:hypothetical protein [Actinomadura livida]|uniref:Uncharacterized protein n=1 Tax=Actinomadura livida TaxID=79909 RepID=A0A7W7IIM8_9ACTN|nr:MULTISPECIES: hypothetical protein [Actinomadura]MBB4777423.1 hypothetical protein [Actinomadura catellatispora]